VDGDVPSGVDAVDLAVEGRVGQRGMVFGVLPLDEQPPLVGIPWVQAWVVLLADAGAEVGHGEHAAVQGVLRIGQVTMRVQAPQELSDGRGVFALVVGLAEVLAAVASDVEELGDGGLLQAGLLTGPVHPCGDHPRQCVAVGVVEVSTSTSSGSVACTTGRNASSSSAWTPARPGMTRRALRGRVVGRFFLRPRLTGLIGPDSATCPADSCKAPGSTWQSRSVMAGHSTPH
jgi:hypothetical protein